MPRILLTASTALFLFLHIGCGGGGSNTTPPPPPPGAAATPTFNPAAGTYSSAQSVTISDTSSGATIYYTTDGSTPTTASTAYTGPVQVSATNVLKAMASGGGFTSSPAKTGIYMIAGSTGTPNYTWNNVQIVAGGFITGIVAHPAQQGLMYTRTDIGGAYRWDNANQVWIPLTDWISAANSNYIGIESIGIDPSDVNRLYLAGGTYIHSWAGNGAMLVSDDQGATFTTVPMPFKMGGNENGRSSGERFGVDPNSGNIVYFGSRLNGMWKSTDHGSTWAQVATFPVTGAIGTADSSGNYASAGTVFVDFIKSSGTAGNTTPVIYVGVSDIGPGATVGTYTGTYNGLYRSTDGGSTWSAVPGQPTGLFPNHGVFGPDGNLYISYGDNIGPNGMTKGDIYKYTPPPNGAGTWAKITPSFTNNGGYGAVAVDAHHAGTLMVSTLDNWGPHDDLYRSTDGGTTWTALRSQAVDDASLSPWVGMLQPTPLGWWMGALAIDPFNSNHVLYGTGATIWASTDVTNADSAMPTHWSVGALGIEETAVTQLVSPPSGANLVSGVGDICGFVHTTLTSTPSAGFMTNPQFSTTSGLDFAQNVPATMARVGYNDTATQRGGFSTNGGTTWTPFPANPSPNSQAGSIAVSADGTRFVWATGDQPGTVAYSTNHGTSWTASSGAPANQVVVADRFNSSKFYMANGTTLFVSTDGGATFTSTGTLPASGTVVAAPTFEGDLWLATSGGLYRSADSGKSFLQLSGVQKAQSVGFGKAVTGGPYPALYLLGQAGTAGFFRSLDGGATWVQINDATHQYGNAGIVIGDPRVFGRIYIGTNGNGIIYGDSTN